MSATDSESRTPRPPERRPFENCLGWTLKSVIVAAFIGLICWEFSFSINKRRSLANCREHFKQIGLALHMPTTTNTGRSHRRTSSAQTASDGTVGACCCCRTSGLRTCIINTISTSRGTAPTTWHSPGKFPKSTLARRPPGLIAGLRHTSPWWDGRRPGLNSIALWKEDFHDGTSNTIQLVECARLQHDLDRTAHDLTHQDAMKFDQAGSHPHPSSAHQSGGAFLILVGDSAVRSINTTISRDTFRSLLSINGGSPLRGVDWPLDTIPAMSELPTPRRRLIFPLTDILPHPSEPIAEGRNYVYCATFAIAWDDACEKCGGRPLRLGGRPAIGAGT